MFDFSRFEFRNVQPSEGREVAEIERLCFPPEEACSPLHMEERVRRAPETFLVAFDRVNHKIAGFLNGLATSETAFRDEFFTDASLHEPGGKSILLLGLDVRPEYRRRGLATALMERYVEREAARGRERLILTCHAALVGFYEELGYEDLSIGGSVWGGSRWHDMQLLL